MRDIALVAYNLRSCHNVGSILRTAEGLGVSKVLLTGYTPYPSGPNDKRLPHQSTKISNQIQKTALGAEKLIAWQQYDNADIAFKELHTSGYTIVALEQSKDAIPLPSYRPPQKIALVVGSELAGLEPDILRNCDAIIEIPMFGSKESYNVVQATAMALYYCRFEKNL